MNFCHRTGKNLKCGGQVTTSPTISKIIISQKSFQDLFGRRDTDIQKHFKYDIFGSNICILERIEIIPCFREYNLAAKATKYIVFHFSGNCALFVIQAYPLQFEAERSEQSKWQKQLELNLFPTNEKLAFKKLSEYYQSFGFEKIKRYDDLLFYNPLVVNKKLENINLKK